MNNVLRRMFGVSKLAKRETKWKRAQPRKKSAKKSGLAAGL
jgi:hypothetical protein